LKALIVGGGIIGGSIAWRLAAEGVAVTVFERGRLGLEASWAAAGMLAPQAEAEGPGPILDICLRGREAFDRIVERLIRESGVDPEYDQAGILYCALDADEQRQLEGRARWQRRAGLGGEVEELDGAAARRIEPMLSPEVCYALHLPTNRRVENRKLTQAYTAAAIKAGAEFRESSGVAEIIARNSDRAGVRLDDGSLHEADFVINAAGAWAARIRGLEADRIAMRPVRGQIVCFQGRPAMLGPAIFSLRGYLVPRRDGRVLAGSTMDDAGFDRSVTMAGMGRIVAGANALIPALSGLAFREAWAGFRPATDDKLPILGPSTVHPQVLYATAHFRSGILLSAITGEVIADLIKGRKPSFDLTPYSPRRFSRGESR
jgi:glycine oxidase